MKRFFLSMITVGAILTLAYQAKAASDYTASSVWYETYNTCCWPSYPPERHWSVDFPGANCNTQGNPRYSGSSIGDGHWRDHNTWQLTKSWMQGQGCLDWWPCTACTQTTQGCSVSNFKAWCEY
ncbi:MAG: hypothetical protein IT441_05130 [Phycisphaeraceae bacterium]|nr:hypothetical protein [Phycisphaeraceae bacterium]